MPATKLTPEQFKEAVSLGSVPEVRDLANDGYSFDDIKDILETQRSARQADRAEDIGARAMADAAANKKVMRPENESHPAKSVYSYPEGDVARPRPELRCRTFWLAEELDNKSVTTAKELELLNQIQPGRYICHRPDGTPMTVDVKVELSDTLTGKWERLTVWFKAPDGMNVPSRVAMLTDIIEQQNKLVLA